VRVEFVVELLQYLEQWKAYKDFASSAKSEKNVGTKFDYQLGDTKEDEEEKKKKKKEEEEETEVDEMEGVHTVEEGQDTVNQVDKAMGKMKLSGESSTAASIPKIYDEWLQRPRF
jgi:hypothetical protein